MKTIKTWYLACLGRHGIMRYEMHYDQSKTGTWYMWDEKKINSRKRIIPHIKNFIVLF